MHKRKSRYIEKQHKKHVREVVIGTRLSPPEYLLLLALNNDPFPTTGKRDTREEVDSRVLLLFVKRFQQLSEAIQRSRPKPRSSNFFDFELEPEARRAFLAINRLMTRYLLMPVIAPANQHPGWELDWWRTGERSQPVLEFGYVLKIKELAEEGRLSSLKQCATCKRWLFARFPNQRFCSEKCRIAEFRKGDEARLKRNAYARELYHAKKALEEGKRR
jgi:hypothetical protein